MRSRVLLQVHHQILRDISLQREDCVLLNQPGPLNPGWQSWVQQRILQVLYYPLGDRIRVHDRPTWCEQEMRGL